MKTLFVILFLTTISFADDPNKISSTTPSLSFEELKRISLKKIVDTVYTLSDYFVEIDLSKQLGYLHSRFDSVKHLKYQPEQKELRTELKPTQAFLLFSIKQQNGIQLNSTVH